MLWNKVQVWPAWYAKQMPVQGPSLRETGAKGADRAWEMLIRKTRDGRRQANRRGKLARNIWAEQHPKGTSWKIVLLGNKPHLSWVPASQKSSKEDNSSQKEIVIHLFAGNVTEEGKAALSQRELLLFSDNASPASEPIHLVHAQMGPGKCPLCRKLQRGEVAVPALGRCVRIETFFFFFFLWVNTHVQPLRAVAKCFAADEVGKGKRHHCFRMI